ncbi:hypothetical protein [Halobacteriovorax marinus]|nr:hypothetical protein [Halobacteriovorax marinus]
MGKVPFATWSLINNSNNSGFDDIKFPNDPLSTHSNFEAIEKSYNEYYKYYFPRVVSYLNKINDTNLSAKYWSVIIAPWLSCLIQTVLERNMRLSILFEEHGKSNLKLNGINFLNEESLFEDSYDFQVNGMRNPYFQEWILSRLIELRCKEVPKGWHLVKKSIPFKKLKIQSSDGIKEKSKFFIKNLFSIYGVKGISFFDNLKFSLTLLLSRKKSIKETLFESSRIDGLDLWSLILCSMPRRYKTISSRRNLLSGIFLKKAIIVSGTQLYTEDKQKEYFADFVEAGGMLYSVQHGSHYGYIKYYTYCNEVEYKHDGFITWGWKKQGHYQGRFIPLKSPQISEFSKSVKEEKSNDIVFIGTAMPACFDNIMSITQSNKYLFYRKDKISFLRSLDSNVFKNLYYRPYFNFEYLYADEEYVKRNVPSIEILKGDLHSKLTDSKLVIMDNPGTTLNLCMGANIPTLCFWEEGDYIYTSDGKRLFESLVQAEILFHCPKKAAEKVNEINDDIQKWWLSETVQKARADWVDEYALLGSDWRSDWMEFCKKI